MKALIDTGASVSLLREKEYRRVKQKNGLLEADIEITEVDGAPPPGDKRDGEAPSEDWEIEIGEGEKRWEGTRA